MEGNLDEAQLKQLMVQASSTVVGIVDSSKFDDLSFSVFARPTEIQRLITDDGAPPLTLAALRAAGVQVDLV
jgi:DeoR/GlpR family transcriptional regulator of sugar metabolism